MPETSLLVLSGGVISILLGVVGVFLYQLLGDIKENTKLCNSISFKIGGMENNINNIYDDVLQARELRTEFRILQNEFRLYKLQASGNGGFAYSDSEEASEEE